MRLVLVTVWAPWALRESFVERSGARSAESAKTAPQTARRHRSTLRPFGPQTASNKMRSTRVNKGWLGCGDLSESVEYAAPGMGRGRPQQVMAAFVGSIPAYRCSSLTVQNRRFYGKQVATKRPYRGYVVRGRQLVSFPTQPYCQEHPGSIPNSNRRRTSGDSRQKPVGNAFYQAARTTEASPRYRTEPLTSRMSIQRGRPSFRGIPDGIHLQALFIVLCVFGLFTLSSWAPNRRFSMMGILACIACVLVLLLSSSRRLSTASPDDLASDEDDVDDASKRIKGTLRSRHHHHRLRRLNLEDLALVLGWSGGSDLVLRGLPPADRLRQRSRRRGAQASARDAYAGAGWFSDTDSTDIAQASSRPRSDAARRPLRRLQSGSEEQVLPFPESDSYSSLFKNHRRDRKSVV